MKKTTENIKFSYLYRDAGNYKRFGEVIFSNPNQLDIQRIENLIRSKLIDGLYLYAEDWALPDLHFNHWLKDQDHEFHEFESLTYTNEDPNSDFTLGYFLELIEKTRWIY